MATYVGKWDCPACGTKRIPGWENGRTVERCPSCGSPCTKKWYLDDREMVIADPEEIRKAKSKRAWTCGHCNHVNDAEDTECDSCGNPRDASTDDKQVVAKTYAPDDVPTTTEEVAKGEEESVGSDVNRKIKVQTPRKFAKQEEQWKEKRRKRIKWLKIISGAGLLVVSVLLLLSWKKEINVRVKAFSWERITVIEDYAPRRHDSWDYPPADAYNITSAEEVHHYDQVFSHTDCNTETYSYVCGTTDNGNGTFSDEYCSDTRETCTDVYDDVPVYQTKYYYTRDEWEPHHNQTAAEENKTPYWPEDPITLSKPDLWREGAKTGKYFFLIGSQSVKDRLVEVGENLWNETQQNAEIPAFKNQVFGFWMGLKTDGL